MMPYTALAAADHLLPTSRIARALAGQATTASSWTTVGDTLPGWMLAC
jgi:hypothetical protein